MATVIIDLSENTQDEKCFVVNIFNRLKFLKSNIKGTGRFMYYNNETNMALLSNKIELNTSELQNDEIINITHKSSWCVIEKYLNNNRLQ